MTRHLSKSLAFAIAIGVAASARAAVFYEIDRIDDNTLSISGTGVLDTAVNDVEAIFFLGASSQTSDGPATLIGDLGFGGFAFDSGGPNSREDIFLSFSGVVDLLAGSEPEGVGGFSTSAGDFTVAPVGATGDVAVVSGLSLITIGSYTVVPEPASLSVLTHGAMLAATRRRRPPKLRDRP